MGKNCSKVLNQNDCLNCSLLEDILKIKSDSARKIVSSLQETFKICDVDNSGTEEVLLVRNPYLTQEMEEELKRKHGHICLQKLIQYLRMHLPMDEGPYNELYHLNNCACHSHGWTFLVGDRVMAGTVNVELFDVMCYNEEKQMCYLLHVKKGSDADSSRAACSQVNVCKEEIVRAVTVDTDFDIFDQFFQRAMVDSER